MNYEEDLETIDNDTPIQLEDIECEASASPEEENVPEAIPFPNVNIQLSASGQGYYSYSANRDKQFALSKTIQAIEAIGKIWFNNHRTGPLIGVGNISLNGGGLMHLIRVTNEVLTLTFGSYEKRG
jgi:hypothetical protein